MTSEEKLRLAARAADAKQARDLTVLHLSECTLMTDYFVLCSGASSTHIRTIVDGVLEAMKRAGMGGIRVEGYDAATWVLMDYGDVVVHVMDPERRDYYRLESLWEDAPRLPLDPLLSTAEV
ncbi:MAG TPA: ribosome silencing factor [Chthonomonadales bacterium]|nr:ribosome silencing factor [Chthonomonadales bacterium]